jgi:hypothetical protein
MSANEQERYLILSIAEYKSLKIALEVSDLPMLAGATLLVREPDGTLTNMKTLKEI